MFYTVVLPLVLPISPVIVFPVYPRFMADWKECFWSYVINGIFITFGTCSGVWKFIFELLVLLLLFINPGVGIKLTRWVMRERYLSIDSYILKIAIKIKMSQLEGTVVPHKRSHKSWSHVKQIIRKPTMFNVINIICKIMRILSEIGVVFHSFH
jgi:hypothetical protein